jgi:hypothetical protein
MKENEKNAVSESDQAQDQSDMMAILEAAERDRDDIQKTMESEKDRSKKALEAKLAERKRNGKLNAKQQLEQKLREEEQKVQDENMRAQQATELQMVKAVLDKFPTAEERRSKAKGVIEMVLQSKFNQESKQQMKLHLEQRAAYFQESLAAEENPNYAEVQAKVNAELDNKQGQEISDLRSTQHEYVKSLFKSLYPDENFSSAQWASNAEDEVDTFKQKREEVLQREKKKIEQEHSSSLEALKLRQEQYKKEQEAKIKEEELRMEQMIAEADERAKRRNQKMIELREEMKKKELDGMQNLGEQQREGISIRQILKN